MPVEPTARQVKSCGRGMEFRGRNLLGGGRKFRDAVKDLALSTTAASPDGMLPPKARGRPVAFGAASAEHMRADRDVMRSSVIPSPRNRRPGERRDPATFGATAKQRTWRVNARSPNRVRAPSGVSVPTTKVAGFPPSRGRQRLSNRPPAAHEDLRSIRPKVSCEPRRRSPRRRACRLAKLSAAMTPRRSTASSASARVRDSRCRTGSGD